MRRFSSMAMVCVSDMAFLRDAGGHLISRSAVLRYARNNNSSRPQANEETP